MQHNASKHLVYINGEMFPPDAAKISVFDSAVTLGDTITESTRTFGHEPFKLERHVERLYKSLKVGRINPGITPQEMIDITLEVLREKSSPRARRRRCLDRAQHLARGRGAGSRSDTSSARRPPLSYILRR